MKYKSETEFCEAITKLIFMDLSTQIDEHKIQVLAEVPRFSHNNHSDILLIDRTNEDMLVLEYKLSGAEKLSQQTEKSPITTFGIINSNIKQKPISTAWDFYKIFQYTGGDYELEHILARIKTVRWTTIYEESLASIYWFGYMNCENSFAGGLANAKRLSFYQLYKNAIKNVLEQYPCADFFVVHRILGYYSTSVSKKYYNKVLSDKRRNKK